MTAGALIYVNYGRRYFGRKVKLHLAWIELQQPTAKSRDMPL